MESKNSKTIGILGGLGPFAGLDISKKILINTKVKDEKDHLNQIHFSFPGIIPDRSMFIEGKKNINPANSALSLIKIMIDSGAEVIGVACNQMHHPKIWEIIANNINTYYKNVTLVNMVDEVKKHISTLSINKLAILGRNGTIHEKIYHNKLKDSFDIYNLSDNNQNNIDDCIANVNYGIKYHPDPIKTLVVSKLESNLAILENNNVSHAILACTELPLGIAKIKQSKIKFIDAGEILAKSLIYHATNSIK